MIGLSSRLRALCFLSVALALPGSLAVAAAPPVPSAVSISVTAGGADFQGATSFEVRASRFGLSTRRQVDVRAAIYGTDGMLQVRFDRPVKPMLGVDRIEFRVRVIDAEGEQTGILEARLEPGAQGFDLPFTLKRPGLYRLVLSEEDISAGKARVSIKPDGRAHLDIAAAR